MKLPAPHLKKKIKAKAKRRGWEGVPRNLPPEDWEAKERGDIATLKIRGDSRESREEVMAVMGKRMDSSSGPD